MNTIDIELVIRVNMMHNVEKKIIMYAICESYCLAEFSFETYLIGKERSREGIFTFLRFRPFVIDWVQVYYIRQYGAPGVNGFSKEDDDCLNIVHHCYYGFLAPNEKGLEI